MTESIIFILVSAAIEIAVLIILYTIMTHLRKMREYAHMQTVLLKKLLLHQGEDINLDELMRSAKKYVKES